MKEFEDFRQWCQYWSQQFTKNNQQWRTIRINGQDSDNYQDKYICRIEFDTNGDSAYYDVHTYGTDYGYGAPHGFVNNGEHNCWHIYLDCPDLPLVIRMANNHGGRITWWNNKFLQKPTMNIPFFIPSKPKEKKGCYIATAVYGSYNCPEVCTLRRYRDFTLDKTWYGKAFIHIYYTISPILVKYYGNSSWFVKLWRKLLDKIVFILKERGIEESPYNDLY